MAAEETAGGGGFSRTLGPSGEGGGGGGIVGAVTKIIPGTGIGVAPGTGIGAVTVSNSGVLGVPNPSDGVIGVTTAAGIATLTQNIVATWGAVGSLRYFACDTTAGNDTNAGFSDVSQAAAGLVAVKTLARLMQIIPKFGNGRKFRAAVKAGNYASDLTFPLSGFTGYASTLIIATDTVVSAGAVAFAGNANDAICAGMTTATGMNAGGYNPTAYSVDGEGTPIITLQLAGGGAVVFPAAPARPHGARLRFDVTTPTAALRNFGDSVLLVPTPGGAQLILGQPLPANPIVTDICYLEMPNVSGPTSTLVYGSQGINQLQVCGFKLGVVFGAGGGLKLVGCETGAAGLNNMMLDFNRQISDPSGGAPNIGIGTRSSGLVIKGGILTLFDWCDTTTASILEGITVQAERWSAGGMIAYGGTHAVGNRVIETLGTHSSTVHGATCQIWQPHTVAAGVLGCGLACFGGFQIGRIKFSNMGANPGCRINGAGLGVSFLGLSGGIADGNTDVGVDLSPSGFSGDSLGATGTVIANSPGGNTLTGTTGDIRLSDGTITTWANATAGIIDANGNRLFGAGNAPDHPVPVAAGAGVLAVTNAPAGAVAYARYFKIPDGAGGFYTMGSLT